MKKSRISTDEKINLGLKFLMALLFVVGALIFFYPFVVDSVNNYLDQQRIAYYIEETQKENQANIEKNKKEAERFEQQNKKLANTITLPGMKQVKDPFANINEETHKPTKAYYTQHNIGAIFIPVIEVSLPVFDTTNEELLSEGATVLQGSSYPVGGSSTHSVITGHTGLPDKTLFTNLIKLKKGEMIYLHSLNKKLAYQITSLKVVKPDQLEDLKIIEGEDLLTLVTCTPYMVNTDRLLVLAKRVPYKENQANQSIKATQNYHRWKLLYTLVGVGLFFLLFFLWIARKIWLFRGLKHEYSVTFYLENAGESVRNQKVQLVYGWNHRPLKTGGEIKVATSTEQGLVLFEKVPGNNYRAIILQDPKKWPRIRIGLRKLRAEKLIVKVNKRNRRMEGEGWLSRKVFVQKIK